MIPVNEESIVTLTCFMEGRVSFEVSEFRYAEESFVYSHNAQKLLKDTGLRETGKEFSHSLIYLKDMSDPIRVKEPVYKILELVSKARRSFVSANEAVERRMVYNDQYQRLKATDDYQEKKAKERDRKYYGG